jgi:hypothetical protein
MKHWYLVRESGRPQAAGLEIKLIASVGGETAFATEPTQATNPLALRRRRPRLLGEPREGLALLVRQGVHLRAAGPATAAPRAPQRTID